MITLGREDRGDVAAGELLDVKLVYSSSIIQRSLYGVACYTFGGQYLGASL